MLNLRHVILLASALLLALVHATNAAAQQDQHALARQLLHGNREDQSAALETASRVGRAQIGPELRAALITVLERSNSVVAEAAKRNQAVETIEDPEFIAHVAHVVSQLDDPKAISALAGALGSGSTLVPDALADFGNRSASSVLAVVTSPTSGYNAVDDGLIALRFMVEGTGSPPLSSRSLEQIRAAAKQRLTGKQYFTTLLRAIDLAVTLDDPDLRQVVQSLAADPSEVVARGVTNRDIVNVVQQRANQRLNGERSLPRHRSLTERDSLLNPAILR